MNCRGCEFIKQTPEEFVCGYPGPHENHHVSPNMDESPLWCPLTDTSKLSEAYRAGLLLMYHNAGFAIPERLYPKKECNRELPRGDR